ncbi:glycerophosphocholine phosphodiesterase GPCPD1-like [Daphnia pulex]|uniref:glycerophosphocholine phosphodiesterase GPCPD1-like n=1 Tax=Daphnia pulex TaxID=6669 RepID=UPI001EDD4A51|nr:glycerophosphocholine phosphodiesterase GPCPD1-like [Daphnia pulex]
MFGREWNFRVTLRTTPGECVGVVGNCHQLGNWNHQNGILLTKSIINSSDGNEIWQGTTQLPVDQEVHFRYFTCIVLDHHLEENEVNGRVLIMRRWETNISPRIIKINSSQNDLIHIDLFGTYNGETRVDRGWLTKETVVQLKLYNDPIRMWKKSLHGKSFRVKVTPVDVDFPCNNTVRDGGVDESWDVQDVRNAVKSWPLIEVASMSSADCEFQRQQQFGELMDRGSYLIFQAQVTRPESVTFLVDFYAHNSSGLDSSEHIGFCYVLQNNMTQSEGSATVPITSPKHLAIGQLKVDYLIVRPMNGFECDMSISFARHWKHSWRGLEVGHRGAGSSFKEALKSCSSIRENTIASLAHAAEHGADMIEFDVQLSKDMVPVIYHDFYVYTAMMRKLGKDECGNGASEGPFDMLHLPIKELTLAQLQKLKIYHVKENSRVPKLNDDDFDDHQPFPTLQRALEHLDPHVGFNVEIKWTMQLKDGSFELNNPFELNVYLDTILKPVLMYGGSRKIIFSCFHPDICTVLRMKQNKYPVMFLTQGITAKFADYHDPRTHNIPTGVHFVLSIGILGLCVHSEDILRDPTQVALVQSRGLILFCWGEDNNDQATIRYLKNLGLNGIIYDKIDVHSAKETKESIFLVEARQEQKELIKIASSTSSSS